MRKALVLLASLVSLGLGAVLVTSSNVSAAPEPTVLVCPDFDFQNEPPANAPVSEYTAPDGFLVDQVCVRAITEGDSPAQFTKFDPPQKTVTIKYDGVLLVRDYSVSWVAEPDPTTPTPTATPTQAPSEPAPQVKPTVAVVPTAVAAGL